MKKIILPEWLKLVKGNMVAEDDEPVDLLLAEPIGFEPENYTGISSARFGQVLGSIPKEKVVNLLLDTLGGSIPAGMAMHNMIMKRGNVNCIVIGYAASMGSVIMQGAAHRLMMPGTICMIHNPQWGAEGDYREFDKASEKLQTIGKAIIDLYSNRTGISAKRIKEMMDEETYMDPEAALEAGFCDEVIDSNEAWNKLAVRRAPTMALKLYRSDGRKTVEASSGVEPKKVEQTSMKKSLAVLLGAGLVSSVDLTDETAALELTNNIKGLTDLRAENKKFIEDRKTRITSLVNALFDEELIPEGRKAGLLRMGEADEQSLIDYALDLRNAKASGAPVTEVTTEVLPPSGKGKTQPRGAAPVPPKKDTEGEQATNDAKIEELQKKLKGANGEEAYAITGQIRALKNRGNLFVSTAEKK